MGFRFRKSISIIPGVRLNISKSGFSTSVGRPGATVNIGKRGVRGTVGLPGSGLSYSETLYRRGQKRTASRDAVDEMPVGVASSGGRGVIKIALVVVLAVVFLLFVIGLIFGPSRTEVGSGGFQPEAKTLSSSSDNGSSVASQSAASTVSVAEGVNCRSNPNQRASVVTKLSGDEELEVIDRQGAWTRVTFENQDCWVSSALVR